MSVYSIARKTLRFLGKILRIEEKIRLIFVVNSFNSDSLLDIYIIHYSGYILL